MIMVVKMETKLQIADIFTKPLPLEDLDAFDQYFVVGDSLSCQEGVLENRLVRMNYQ